ncbi:MAG TPA: ECF transporter S component [Mycobacteriales bacterium]|nr:ECF transporter S component [Mycobacteriales bacterium]
MADPDRRPARAAVVPIRWRSAVALSLASAVGVVGFGWPLLAEPGSRLSQGSYSPWLFALLLPLLLAVVLAEVADGGMDAKAVALLGVLAAIGAALRPLGAGAAGIEPMFFLLVLAGRVLGRGFGFVLGAVSLFASALLTGGVGPWLSFQMLGASWIGFGAGCLPRRPRGRLEVAVLAGYGVLAGLGYGLLLNLSLWPFLVSPYDTGISFRPGAALPENLRRLVAFTLSTSLGFDIPRAITNVVLIIAAGPPVLLALRRAARRAAFDTPTTFAPADPPLSPDHRNPANHPSPANQPTPPNQPTPANQRPTADLPKPTDPTEPANPPRSTDEPATACPPLTADPPTPANPA